MGMFLGQVAAIPFGMRRALLERKVLRQFGKRLSQDELEVLTQCGRHHGKVTRNEFVLNMLLKLERVNEDDVRQCEAQFDLLDRNHNQVLTSADVLAAGRQAVTSLDAMASRMQTDAQQQGPALGWVAGGGAKVSGSASARPTAA